MAKLPKKATERRVDTRDDEQDGPIIRFDLDSVPRTIWDLRRELAECLRDRAKREPAAVAKALREVADVFEAGQADKLLDDTVSPDGQ